MELKSDQEVLGEVGADGCVKNAISVIIPCYNYGKYLGEAIESVTAQTRKPIEIIVMDDASTDNTSEVAKSFPVRYVRNPLNLGASENFNLGIRLARGEYILHLDADDRLRPEFLAKTASILDIHPDVAIAYTHLTLFGLFAKEIYDTMPERKMGLDNGSYLWRVREFDRHHLLKRGNYIHSASLFRKSAFEEAGGYPDLPHREDYEFWRNIIKLGWDAKLVPEYLVDYRQHSPSQRNIARKSSFRKYTRIIFKNLIYRLGFNRY